jgi:hypothetical protein
MKFKSPCQLSALFVLTALAFAPLAAAAQDAPMMGGGMQGGHKMGGGMKGEDMMKGDGMMGGGVMGSPEHMSHMMSRMKEELSHAADRVAAIKTELKITEAQTPAWNKFADALLAAAKSSEVSMDVMYKHMMAPGAAPSLPEKLDHNAKMAAEHQANLQAIKAALDPLYASFSDEQKRIADGLKVGPMGVM